MSHDEAKLVMMLTPMYLITVVSILRYETSKKKKLKLYKMTRMFVKFTLGITLTLCFMLVMPGAHAGNFSMSVHLSKATKGSQVVVNDLDTVEVADKNSPGFTDIALSNYLTLTVDQNHPVLVSANQTTVVIVQVTPYDTNDVAQTPFNETLSVAYNPTLNSATFTDRHTRKFSTAWYKFEFEITSIKVNGVNAPLPLYLDLEGKIDVERIYHFTSVVNTPLVMNTIEERNLDCDGGGIIDEVEISWAGFTGTVQADEYQLEWTFINDYDTGVIANTKSLDEIKFDFRNNSTRVTTTNTSYLVPLLFDRGYLIYRVRAIGYDTANPTIPMFSDWNVVDADSLSGAGITSDNYYYVDTPHESNKNWQVTTTFAEEGKKKEVVSYFDGSLRNRQTVTRINSDNKTIVGETIYDYQGRPAVTVLPVPVPDFACLSSFSTSVIRYFPNFNVDTNGIAYGKSVFDIDDTSGICNVLAPPLYDSVGASYYYSTENTSITREQAFVPDANGYPFTQVEYTNDNTGRIRKQGGVGEQFQLGSGHETGYLYGQPNQIQLDRMFGSEVGDATHYKKNVVIDPNGQASVSYLDQEGRVIATALAGDSTNNLHALPSNTASTDVVLTVDLFNKDANGNSNSNTINANNNGIEFHTELLVAYQSNYEFDYGIEIDTLSDTCLKEDICISCVYNLKIQVLDECGVDMVQAAGDTINGLIGHFALNGDALDFVTTCHSPSTYDTALNFTLNLDPGVYTVVKKLSLNLAWRDSVVAAYLDTANNHCVMTLQDFIDAEMEGIDTSGCHIDCEECLASLGTRDDFVASGKGTALQYDILVEECEAPCRQTTLCENTYQQMLMDVTPGGQYAEYSVISGAYNVGMHPLSVLNELNLLPDNHHPGPDGNIWERAWWRNPQTIINGTVYPYYFDENGSQAKIYLTTDVSGNWLPDVYDTDSILYDALGQAYIEPQQCAQLKDFINAFKPAWAKALVGYHPEYCYYHTCSGYAEEVNANDVFTSESFDALLRSCESYQQAVDTGLIDAGTGLPTDWFTFSSTDPYDPFVVRDHGSYSTTLESKFDDFVFYTSGNYSMTEQAAIMARCGGLTGVVPDASCLLFGTDHITGATAHNTEIRDKEWAYLRDFYLSEKYQLQVQRADSIALYDCYEFNDCIGNSEVWSYMYPMSIASNGAGTPAFQNLAQPCSYGYDQLYASKQKRFPDINDIPGVSAGGTDPMETAYQQYLITGQCPLTSATQNLLSSLADSSFLLNDTVDLMYFPYFNPVYVALNNFQPVAPISQYNYLWLADTTGWVDEDTLRVNLMSDNDTCYFHLDKNGSGITDWEDILGFSGMVSTGYSTPEYSFTINAHVEPDSGTYHPYKLVEISGVTTCWNIDQCNFPLSCTPTELGYNIYTLMNVLAMEDDFEGTNIALDTDMYDSLMLPVIYTTLGQTSNASFKWTYNAGDSTINIFKSGAATNRIRLKIQSHIPTSFNLADLDSIEAFTNLVMHDAGYFSVDGHDSLGNYKTTIEFLAIRKTSFDSTNLNISDCDQPQPITCEQDPDIAAGDLYSDFIKDILLKKTWSSGTQASASAYFGPDFEALLDYPVTPISNTYTPAGTPPSTETWTIGLDSACTLEFRHVMYPIPGVPAASFGVLASVSGIYPWGEVDEDGLYHEFYLIGNFANPTRTDTIFGESCIGWKPCQPCVDTSLYPELIYNDTTEADDGDGHMLMFLPGSSPDLGPASEWADVYKADLYSYAEYKKLMYSYHASHTARSMQLPVMSLSEFRKNKMREKVKDYKLYIEGKDKWLRGSPPPMTLSQFTASLTEMNTGSGGGFQLRLTEVDSAEFSNDCDSLYDLYLTEVEAYNDWADTTSHEMIDPSYIYTEQQFNDSMFCYCVQSFIAVLRSAEHGTISSTSLTFTDFISDPQSWCDDLMEPPCAPNNGPIDTIASIPYTYVNPCVQYQLEMAVVNATNAYNAYLDSLTTYIANKYTQHCLGALETFTDEYSDKEYHFTLYYYDQAGNLVKTVPPQGVQLLNITSPTSPIEIECIADRTYGTTTADPTTHVLSTRYEYNSLNQLVKQTMPDHDNMNLWETKLPNGLDSNLTVNDVQFVDGSRGYLCGSVPGGFHGTRGLFYKTNDAGETWQKQSNVIGTDFTKIQMVDTLWGYAVGTRGVAMITQDGGSSWDQMSSYHVILGAATPRYNFQGVNDVNFISRYRGLMVSNGGIMIPVDSSYGNPSLANDGYTRITVSGSDTYNKCTSVTDGNGTLWYVTVNSTDASAGTGLTFNQNCHVSSGNVITNIVTLSKESMNNVSFIDTVKAYACSNDGRLYYSADKGVTWTNVPVYTSDLFKDVYFRSKDDGVALIETGAGQGAIYATHDGGVSWTLLSDASKDYNAFSPYEVGSTSAKLVAVGENGAVGRVLLVDGTSYGMIEEDEPSATDDFTTCWGTVVDSKPWLYMGGSATAKLYRGIVDASTGTVTWKIQTLPGITGIKRISMQNFAATDPTSPCINGSILTSGNLLYKAYKATLVDTITTGAITVTAPGGGIPTSTGFTDIIVQNDRFYAVNNTAQVHIYYSAVTNSAAISTVTYVDRNLNTGIYPQSAANRIKLGSNNKTLLLAGNAGRMEQARFGAATTITSWASEPSAIRTQLMNASDKSGTRYMAVGENGQMQQFTNSGSTHYAITFKTGIKENINEIELVTDTTGYVVCDSGKIYAFTNHMSTFSTTFTAITTPVTEDLYDLTVKNDTAYIVGDNGTMLFSPDLSAGSFSIAASPGDVDMKAVEFIPGTSVAISAGENTHMRWLAGTNTVANKNQYTFELNGLHFVDGVNGYTVGDRLTIKHTTDGGATWTGVTTTELPPTYGSVTRLNRVKTLMEDQCVVVGNQNVIQHVNNTVGQSNLLGYGNINIADIDYADPTAPIAAGWSGTTGRIEKLLFDTTTNTLTSDALITSSGNKIGAIKVFKNSSVKFACWLRDDNQMLYSTNGTSIAASPVISALTASVDDIWDVYFHDNNVGYIVGNDGRILKNTAFLSDQDNFTVINPEDSLNSQLIDTDMDMRTIAFSSRYKGFMGGLYNGTSSGVNNTNDNYARTIKDESGYYSTLFWYDKLGRIVVSQNTRQFNETPKKYSYTLYDGLGRVVEAGEKTENHPSRTRFSEIHGTVVNNFFNPLTVDDDSLLVWINDTTGARKEVTMSFYDAPVSQIASTLPASFTQENLRKRISTVMYEEEYDYDTTTYTHATHYTYDIHGNVNTLLQDNKNVTTSNYGAPVASEEFKRIDYTYDLISGNVHEVDYQKDSADQWMHRYEYDADNRIIEAWTSDNGYHWDVDAKYVYYDHGPLARTELGNDQVQGLDYAYTLQGWIKGVNSNQLTSALDIGKDNYIGGSNLHQYFGKDVCGYTLSYFDGDYSPIDYSGKWSTVTNRFEADKSGSDLLGARYNLFNGNIGAMVTSISDTAWNVLPQGNAYQYDQLNRIIQSKSYTNLNTGTNVWSSGSSYANRYFNAFTYDANGNILTQQRHNQAGVEVEDLTYGYEKNSDGLILRNRLYHVDDSVLVTIAADDIDDQGILSTTNYNTANNYKYDEEGRLVQDLSEGIDEIVWRVDGKVKEVRRFSGSDRKNLKFEYDGMGNRIAKHMYTSSDSWIKSTYYVRDAQGNVLATYDKDTVAAALSYQLKELDIYGSSRVGLNTKETEMIAAVAPSATNFTHTLGKKQFEISNHLGNVLEVITDRKYPVDLGDYDSNNDSTNESYVSGTLDGIVDYYKADIVLSRDYTPFGVEMDGRSFNRQTCDTLTLIDTIPSVENTWSGGTVEGWDEIDASNTVAVVSSELRASRTGAGILGMYKYATLEHADYIIVKARMRRNTGSGTAYGRLRLVDTATNAIVWQDSVVITTTNVNYSSSVGIIPAGVYRFECERRNNASTQLFLDNVLLAYVDTTTQIDCDGGNKDYRYSFNGMEKLDELSGEGNDYISDFRLFDPRLGGRWYTPDPVIKPWESPYAGFSNSPIYFKDPSGLNPANGDEEKKSKKAQKSNDLSDEEREELMKNCPGCQFLEEVTVTAKKKGILQAFKMVKDRVFGAISEAWNKSSLKRLSHKLFPGYGYRDGFIEHEKITKKRITELEHGQFKQDIEGVVLHRTVSTSEESPLASFKGSGVGTHFLIGKDGTIYQTSRLDQKAWHVGGGTSIDNHNTIGIEVVGMYDFKNKTWEPVTTEQIESTAWLVNTLLLHHNLTKDNVFVHEKLAAKAKMEGQTVLDAIQNKLIDY